MEQFRKLFSSQIIIALALVFLGFTLSKVFDDYAIYRMNIDNLNKVLINDAKDQVILDFMLDCYGNITSNYTTCVNAAETELPNVELQKLILFFDKTTRPFILYADKSSRVWED